MPQGSIEAFPLGYANCWFFSSQLTTGAIVSSALLNFAKAEAARPVFVAYGGLAEHEVSLSFVFVRIVVTFLFYYRGNCLWSKGEENIKSCCIGRSPGPKCWRAPCGSAFKFSIVLPARTDTCDENREEHHLNVPQNTEGRCASTRSEIGAKTEVGRDQERIWTRHWRDL